jgi:DNA polymerase-3 subunit delta
MARDTTTYQAVLQDIRKGRIAPAYLFHGEEQFLAEQLSDAIVQTAFGAPKDDFNLHVFHAREHDASAIVNAAMSFPMLADRKVVIVRDADQLRKEDRDSLTAYLQHPLASTSLVVVASKADFRQNPFKLLKEGAVCVELKPLREYEAPEWIETFAGQHGKRIRERAAILLASKVDVSLQELSSEVEKLATYAGTREEITEEDVETVVGLSRQYNIFELCSAVGRKDLPRALQIFDRMHRLGEEPVGMIVMLYRQFVILLKICEMRDRRRSQAEIQQHLKDSLRINPYFFENDYWPQAQQYRTVEAEKAFGFLQEADEAIKSSQMESALIMHRLLFKLIRGAEA